MSLIDRIKLAIDPKKETVTAPNSSMSVFATSIPEVPSIIEKKTLDWVLYGENNLYPMQLADLPFGSAIHNSILKTKTKMTHGDGLMIK
jgi:hypothetical protein